VIYPFSNFPENASVKFLMFPANKETSRQMAVKTVVEAIVTILGHGATLMLLEPITAAYC